MSPCSSPRAAGSWGERRVPPRPGLHPGCGQGGTRPPSQAQPGAATAAERAAPRGPSPAGQGRAWMRAFRRNLRVSARLCSRSTRSPSPRQGRVPRFLQLPHLWPWGVTPSLASAPPPSPRLPELTWGSHASDSCIPGAAWSARSPGYSSPSTEFQGDLPGALGGSGLVPELLRPLSPPPHPPGIRV